jgi:plastocyanin domain-containing protein
MDATEIIVVACGGVAIAFVLWYFFGEREAAAASVGTSGVQEIKVTVKGGYSPDVIVVKQEILCGSTSTVMKPHRAASK